jgi:hypothetical protein
LPDKLEAFGLPPLGVSLVMTLYETIIGKVRTRTGETEEIQSTIGVKQGCPLSPTFFRLYIDELEERISDSFGISTCLDSGDSTPLLTNLMLQFVYRVKKES